MENLNDLTATEAAARIADGEISSEDLVRSCLDRIHAREETVGAWQYLDDDRALAAARATDAEDPRGPLHGVPYGVKDIIDTADMPTCYGSPIFNGHQPDRDAVCVARMRAAGAVLLGKTVTTEFATFSPGKTRNPHNPAHTPGGSSSGSGAAVADRMVPIAYGSQTAGSLIRPASFCGVCGFKPSHGVADLSGIFELDSSLDTLGYMGRSFDDVATFHAISSGLAAGPLADGLGRTPRIAICRTFHWDAADEASVAAVEDAAERLAGLGAVIGEIQLPAHFADLIETHRTILNVGLTRSLGALYREHGDRISERLRAMIEDGLSRSSETYDAAAAHTAQRRNEINSVFGDWDVVLSPSAPGEAPEGLSETGNPIFQTVWTLLHVPCATVPGAVGASGLPIGIQFIGRRGDDDTVLKIAKWFHTRR